MKVMIFDNNKSISSVTVPLDYDPRCQLVKKKSRSSGKLIWWMYYYLSNGHRIRRRCDENEGIAKKKIRAKEIQFLQGNFDEKDLEKLEGTIFCPKKTKRLTIDEALSLYFRLSASRKNPKT